MLQSDPTSNCGSIIIIKYAIMIEVKHRCVRQVGLLSTAGVDSWEDLLLVREDRSELTSGVSALAPAGLPSSYVGNG